MSSKTGNIKVNTQDIFPIIKKWLYSEHDIFLRELISNASDAISKRKILSGLDNKQIPEGKIEVTLSKENKTITISDNGLGMTEEEIEKYITQLAFSGAEEFVAKMKEKSTDTTDIIGKFGLGFYSAFMVADKVVIESLSMNDNTSAVKWISNGQTEYTLESSDKKDIGTTITLFINSESEDFLNSWKTREVLKKYCPFMPYPINLVDIDYRLKTIEENKTIEKEEEKKAVLDDIINSTTPLWKKPAQSLKDEDYLNFHRELFPMDEEPLFWLHLNVDHPFNLQGILYFPKIDNKKPIQNNKIHLYAKQVFVSDNVKNIMPEFLGLLKGAIDSPDIPLNVSRSSLVGDPNITKISNYIVKKVAETIKKLYTSDRAKYETIWKDISLFVKYGVISEEKFSEYCADYILFKNYDDKYLTIPEYTSLIPENFKEKLKEKILTYPEEMPASNLLNELKQNNIPCVGMDSYMDQHLTQHLEMKAKDHKFKFCTIDSEYENLFTEKVENEESEAEMKELFETSLKTLGDNYKVEFKNFNIENGPAYLKEDAQMKRFANMTQSMGNGMAFPVPQTLVVNHKHPLVTKTKNYLSENNKELAGILAEQIRDLSRLTQGTLPNADVAKFVQRTENLLLKI